MCPGQEPLSASTARPPPPKTVTKPSPSTTQEVAKRPSTKQKVKTLAGTSESIPRTPPVPRPNTINEPVASASSQKPKPPVSKSGLPRPQVYVEIITKKRMTGKIDVSSTGEKEAKQQGAVGFLIPLPGFGLNDRQNL